MTAPRTGYITKGQNNWQPRSATEWQRQRRDGPILPMLPERKSFLDRVLGR